MSTVIIIGGGPHPQNVTIVPDGSRFKIVNEAGDIVASGFGDEHDAARYLAAIIMDHTDHAESADQVGE